MHRVFRLAAINIAALLLTCAGCAPNPIDASLNAVENSLNALEQDVRAYQGKILPEGYGKKLEEKAATLRKAYADVVKADAATMTKEQEARWSTLRSRSIDVITDMMNLLAQAVPN